MKNYDLSNFQRQRKSYTESVNLYESYPDTQLWELFQHGEGNAFNFIYFKYFPILYNYGCQFTRDKELVKDQIQDLFIYIKTNRKKEGNVRDIKFYLIVSLKRRLQKTLSKAGKSAYIEELQPNQEFGVALAHDSVLINNQEQKQLKKQIEGAINKLSPKQKEAIIYYYYEGFSYDQIAELMSFSKTEYARKLIYRGLNVLRKILVYVIICFSADYRFF